MDDDPQELPWTEEQWEAHLKQSEARAARFGELLETLQDDPDMEVKIDQEMGWNMSARRAREAEDPEGAYDDGLFGESAWSPDTLPFNKADIHFGDDEDDSPGSPFSNKPGAIDAEPEEYEDIDAQPEEDDETELMEFEESDDGDEITAASARASDDTDGPTPFDDDDDDVKEIEAYRKSLAAAERIHHALKTELEKPADSGDEEIGEAFINAHIACAKIAGGHGMGYDEDVLCGNIVCNKIALAANKRCEVALLALRHREVIPAAVIDPLLPDLLAARASIEERIAELRAKVWWDKK